MSSTPFSTVFKTQQSVYKKHIYQSNIFLPISQVFLAFLAKLENLNNLTDESTFLPSAIQALQSKDSNFEVPNLGQLRSIENNPHHWLETDLLQLKQFQYQFFQKITLNE